jgi:hypothetical protein
MNPVINDPAELRRKGFEVLVAALGWANAVQFFRQYEPGEGDYTAERREILPDWDVDTLLQKLRESPPRE